MSTFELQNSNNISSESIEKLSFPRNERVISSKIYDLCRSQRCLRPNELLVTTEQPVSEYLTDIRVDNMEISSITVQKSKVIFKQGYWKIDLTYNFAYTLTPVGSAEPTFATATYKTSVILFGSCSSKVAIYDELTAPSTISDASEPFVSVEAKAIPLEARVGFIRPGSREKKLEFTIGLFSIVKLYRPVDLGIQSEICVPRKRCRDVSPLPPCDFFKSLDFPMDDFFPPEHHDFTAGISLNIPSPDKKSPCDDDCE